MSKGIKLGDTARDTITGFEGVVVCISDYLHGCRRFSLAPRHLHDGKPLEWQSFDEPQVVAIPFPAEPGSGGGGPRPEPFRR